MPQITAGFCARGWQIKAVVQQDAAEIRVWGGLAGDCKTRAVVTGLGGMWGASLGARRW
jgi:hypothetical protein